MDKAAPTVLKKKVLPVKLEKFQRLTHFAYKFHAVAPIKFNVVASIHNNCRIICTPTHTYFLLITKGLVIVIHHHQVNKTQDCIITLNNFRNTYLPLEVRSFLAITRYLSIKDICPARTYLHKYDYFIALSPIFHLQSQVNNFHYHYTNFLKEKLTCLDSFYKNFMQAELKKKLKSNHICIYDNNGARISTSTT